MVTSPGLCLIFGIQYRFQDIHFYAGLLLERHRKLFHEFEAVEFLLYVGILNVNISIHMKYRAVVEEGSPSENATGHNSLAPCYALTNRKRKKHEYAQSMPSKCK